MAAWIQGLIADFGVVAVAVLMFLENLFPPIPSELIMPLAGYFAARGDLGLAGVVIAGTIGSLAGASVWFAVGLWFGEDRLRRLAARLGRVLTLTPDDIAMGDRWFDRHGHIAVLLGRLVPAVRTVISIPAGLSGMTWRAFLFYSAIGTFAWTLLLGGAGYWLGSRAANLELYVGLASNAVVAIAVVLYIWRFATYPRRMRVAAARQGGMGA